MITRAAFLLFALVSAARAAGAGNLVVVDQRAALSEIEAARSEISALAARLDPSPGKASEIVTATSLHAIQERLLAIADRLARAAAPKAAGQDIVLIETIYTPDPSGGATARVTTLHLGPDERLLAPPSLLSSPERSPRPPTFQRRSQFCARALPASGCSPIKRSHSLPRTVQSRSESRSPSCLFRRSPIPKTPGEC